MLILVRYSGEVTTKAKQTRLRFTRQLVENIADALGSGEIPYEIDRQWSRLYVETPSERALAVLKRVPGIQSFSVVEQRSTHDLSTIVETGEELFREHVTNRSFAVRARRGGNKDQIPFTSKDIENELGAALFPYAREVDLDHPERTVYVEVRNGTVYFFSEKIDGPGGIPLGVEGRSIALVSGGFDSAVAAWQMLRRGVALDYVFCQLGGTVHVRSALRVFKVLSDRWSYGDRPRLNILDFRPVVEELRAQTKTRFWQVLLKRLMYRAADQIARMTGRRGIVTGEAVGQVSSQTLQNLHVTSQVTSTPLLRPLLGYDKDAIIQLSRDIGTHDVSANVKEYCALVSNEPATGASKGEISREEEKLDWDVLDRVVEEREVIDLRALSLEDWEATDVEITEIPEDATVLDVRSHFAFDDWHFPGAEQIDFAEALEAVDQFDPDETYVVCCELGLKSANLAEQMRAAGYEAYSVEGGIKTLMQMAVEQEIIDPDALPDGVRVFG